MNHAERRQQILGAAEKATQGEWADTGRVLNPGRVISIAAHIKRPYGASIDPEECRKRFQKVIAYVGNHHCHFKLGESEANAQYISLAHPANIKALIEGYDALLLQARKDALREAIRSVVGCRCFSLPSKHYIRNQITKALSVLIDTPAPETT